MGRADQSWDANPTAPRCPYADDAHPIDERSLQPAYGEVLFPTREPTWDPPYHRGDVHRTTGRGYDCVPGIWNRDQIVAWKEITDAVHANGSSIFLQLWALGLAPRSVTLREDGFELVGPSPVPINPEKYDTPRVLTVIEIHEYVRAYAQAAKNAVEGGFHGVEVHCTNGFLLDQFLQDVSNT